MQSNLPAAVGPDACHAQDPGSLLLWLALFALGGGEAVGPLLAA